jgi:phenylacetate-CoA ligase
MFDKICFYLWHFSREELREALRLYHLFRKTQWYPYEQLKLVQEKQLRNMIDFAYREVPYYTELFDRLHLKPDDIKCVEDLQKLPILTKQEIKKNFPKFTPKNLSKLRYVWGRTGGSTGVPLKYRLSIEDRARGYAVHLRNLGYGGYALGDRMVIIGGASLVPSTVRDWKKRIAFAVWLCIPYLFFLSIKQRKLVKVYS